MKKIIFLLFYVALASMVSAQIQTSTMGSGKVFIKNTKEVALYDQLEPYATAIASQQFPDYGDSRLQVADDFTVPSGDGWNISRVEILATPAGSIPSFPNVSFIIEIYEDNSGLPATTPYAVAENLPFTESSELYSITLNTEMYLPPGDYWICVMPNMDFSLYGQLYWGFAEGIQIGNKLAVQDPDNLLAGAYPISWDYGENSFSGYTAYNSSFAIYGEDDAPASVPLNNWAFLIFGVLMLGFYYFYRRNKLA